MNHPLLVLILLGLAAALMPWQFAYEVYLFGEEKGLKKAASFVSGMTIFRVLLIFIVGLLFAGLTASVTDTIVDIAQFAQSLLSALGREVTSGYRALLDLLLVSSGILLLVEAYQDYRQAREGMPEDDVVVDESKKERNYRSLFLLGFGWMAISLKQWLFTLTAANQILLITTNALVRFLLALFFLLLASLTILLPFVIYLFERESTQATLDQMNTMISSTLGYMIIALMVAGGAYLIWIGLQGLLNYVAMPGGLFF